jgi:hypothetical protein
LSNCIKLIEEQIKTLPYKAMDVPERRRQREQFIRALYALAESRLDVPVPLGDIGQRTGLHIVLARAIGTDLAQSDHVVSHVSENVALTVKGRHWAEELEDPTPTQVERSEQVLAAFLAFVEGVP